MGFGPKEGEAAWSGTIHYVGGLTRSLGTIYQNTSGGVRWVNVSVLCGVQAAGGILAGRTSVYAVVSPNTPPNPNTKTVAICGLGDVDQIYLGNLDPAWDSLACTFNMTFCVPDGYYYEVIEGVKDPGMTISLRCWTEWDP